MEKSARKQPYLNQFPQVQETVLLSRPIKKLNKAGGFKLYKGQVTQFPELSTACVGLGGQYTQLVQGLDGLGWTCTWTCCSEVDNRRLNPVIFYRLTIKDSGELPAETIVGERECLGQVPAALCKSCEHPRWMATTFMQGEATPGFQRAGRCCCARWQTASSCS